MSRQLATRRSRVFTRLSLARAEKSSSLGDPKPEVRDLIVGWGINPEDRIEARLITGCRFDAVVFDRE